jgi:PIN domain nuclease of toxin-antitoxin system
MIYLIDTHVWLWWIAGDQRVVGSAMTAAMSASAARLPLVAPWEIAIKFATGKLRLPEPPAAYVRRHVAAQGISYQPIELDHVIAVSELPMLHRDPFDRLLVAQARVLGATIVTVDQQIAQYDVPVLDPTA